MSKDSSVNASRISLAKAVNKSEAHLSVSLSEIEVQSYLTTATSSEVNGYEGSDLGCETIYEVTKSMVLFELKRYKRSEDIAFGARFYVTERSCVGEDGERSVNDSDSVVLELNFLDFVNTKQTIIEL